MAGPSLLVYVRASVFDGHRLLAAIQNYANDFRLLIFDVMPDTAPPISIDEDPRIRIVKAPFHSPNYQWHLDYNSDGGLKFEEQIARVVGEEIGWRHG